MAGALRDALVAADPKLGRALATNANKAELAMALRQLRFAAGLTQEDVARMAELRETHVSRKEAPYGPFPSIAAIQRYAGACGKNGLRLGFLDGPDDERETEGASDEPGASIWLRERAAAKKFGPSEKPFDGSAGLRGP